MALATDAQQSDEDSDSEATSDEIAFQVRNFCHMQNIL